MVAKTWTPRVTYGLLALVVVAGIVLRATQLSYPGGFGDVGIVQNWGRSVVKSGWTQSYRVRVNNVMRPNYPPVGLAIFGTMVKTYGIVHGDIMENSPLLLGLMKLPSIFADIVLGLLLFAMVRACISDRAGIAAAAVYLLYPATWVISASWGQTDSIYTGLAFGAIVALLWRHPVIAGICMALAFFMKLQAIFFFPVAAVILFTQRKDIEYFLIGALAVTLLIIAPFFQNGTLGDVFDTYKSLVGYYPSLSVYAYNFWWALFGDAARNTSDLKMFAMIATHRTVGLAIVAVIYAAFSWRLWTVLRKNTDLRIRTEAVLAAASVTTLGFFVFSTQMHDRYFFPFVACAVPLLFFMKKGRVTVGFLLLALLFNLLASFPISKFVLYFFKIFPAFDVLVASATFILFIQMAWILWHTSLRPVRGKTVSA